LIITRLFLGVVGIGFGLIEDELLGRGKINLTELSLLQIIVFYFKY